MLLFNRKICAMLVIWTSKWYDAALQSMLDDIPYVYVEDKVCLEKVNFL